MGVDPDAGNEIDPGSKANLPENVAPRDSTQIPGVRDPADIQDERSLVELTAPDGRGWHEGPGEGYNANLSQGPSRHPLHVANIIAQFMSETEATSRQPAQIIVLPGGAPDAADIQNRKSAFERPEEGVPLYASPGCSGHPIPSGEGLSSMPPHSRQAAATKSVTSSLAGVVADDPTLLLSNVGPVAISPEHSPKPAILVFSEDENVQRIPERLNLADFDVNRFEYKTETEPHLSPVLQSAQMLQMTRTSPAVREIKPIKPASSFDTFMQNSNSQSEFSKPPVVLTRPDEVQHVCLKFEPPPPPPVVRTVSMDIGDPESQVRVVIRERNGNLNVQLGSANERLHEDLQVAGPMLMRELQRNNPMPVTLDFSHFGTATDADSQSRSHARAKKFLKPDAEFADVVETAYLPGPSFVLKSV